MRFRITTLLIVLLSGVGLAVTAQVQQVGIQELVESSGTIVAGRVVEVKAGRHPDYPNVEVTYVTLDIESVFKDVGGRVASAGKPGVRRLTFMQFGNPVTLRIHDLPRHRQGEDVILFLYPESHYGFTSPVGGLQGKFLIETDRQTGRRVAVNGFNNFNLFHTLNAEQLQLSSAERKITRPGVNGAADYEAFASLIRKLVKHTQ
jgi:hypothetical protein